jgi:hypothetical protein
MKSVAHLRGALFRAITLPLLLLAACSSPPGDSAGSSQSAVAASRPGHRPANVPAEYVATPYGFFDPSCVARVEPGESARNDGSKNP